MHYTCHVDLAFASVEHINLNKAITEGFSKSDKKSCESALAEEQKFPAEHGYL